ncbi:MAG: Uma2 family endonuclease [Ktedonobacteraceae bacterium]|nr:Uma2 family endonuclease [Ktedonobacteraceae bacterium]
MALPDRSFMSVDDYLTLDEISKEARYEYLDGELYMLAGGSNDHSIIAANLIGIVQQALEESPCRVYTSDIRLQLSESRYVHPDTAVSCDENDIDQEENISSPTFVAEVLSRTTETIDRGKKAIYYRECASIQEYLIIDSRNVHVELYRRSGDIWQILTYRREDTIDLSHLGLQIPVTRLYKKTKVLQYSK